MYSTRLEGIARDLLESSLCGEDGAVDAYELAAACGLHVEHADLPGAVLMGDTIFLGRRTPTAQVHLRIAHEIGHWALDRDGHDQSEQAADYLAAALLVPREQLDRALRGGWDLEALRQRFRHAPASTIACRIAQIRQATAAVYDDGRLRRRVGPVAPVEADLLAAAHETRAPARLDACTGAWPLFGAVRRVVVLAAPA